MSHMGRQLALEGWPEGQAKVYMEEGTEEGGRRVVSCPPFSRSHHHRGEARVVLPVF